MGGVCDVDMKKRFLLITLGGCRKSFPKWSLGYLKGAYGKWEAQDTRGVMQKPQQKSNVGFKICVKGPRRNALFRSRWNANNYGVKGMRLQCQCWTN